MFKETRSEARTDEAADVALKCASCGFLAESHPMITFLSGDESFRDPQ